jgi:glycosyltransferase involved in cell wall biosynthesis
MKIAIVHNRYIHRGGEDVVIENEIEALRPAGLQIETFFPKSDSSLDTVTGALLAPWGGGELAKAAQFLEDTKPDILHVHNLYPLLSARLFPMARKRNIKTVLTLHNFRPLCLNGLFLTPKHEICERCAAGNFLPGVVRGCYRTSRTESAYMAGHMTAARSAGWYKDVNLFIAPSSFLRDKFCQYGMEDRRITVQGHFLPSLPQESPVTAKPYVLYLGRLSEEKGILWLLRAFQSINTDLELVIAGDGPLKPEVSQTRSAKIRYVGFVEEKAKTDLLRQAKALVVPSQCYENFPMAVMEANAYGVPVIAPKRGGLAEIIHPHENGLLYEPDDVQAFARAIQSIQEDRDPMAFRVSSQSHARKTFSQAEFTRIRMPLYESLLAKRL